MVVTTHVTAHVTAHVTVMRKDWRGWRATAGRGIVRGGTCQRSQLWEGKEEINKKRKKDAEITARVFLCLSAGAALSSARFICTMERATAAARAPVRYPPREAGLEAGARRVCVSSDTPAEKSNGQKTGPLLKTEQKSGGGLSYLLARQKLRHILTGSGAVPLFLFDAYVVADARERRCQGVEMSELEIKCQKWRCLGLGLGWV